MHATPHRCACCGSVTAVHAARRRIFRVRQELETEKQEQEPPAGSKLSHGVALREGEHANSCSKHQGEGEGEGEGERAVLRIGSSHAIHVPERMATSQSSIVVATSTMAAPPNQCTCSDVRFIATRGASRAEALCSYQCSCPGMVEPSGIVCSPSGDPASVDSGAPASVASDGMGSVPDSEGPDGASAGV
jgi:hypothetical protein